MSEVTIDHPENRDSSAGVTGATGGSSANEPAVSASGSRRVADSSLEVRSLGVLGVRVDDVTYAETIRLCEGFIASGGHHLIATVNTEFVMAAQSDHQFRRIINESALAVPDGIGLLLAARLYGRPLREHVRGTDLVEQLAPVAAEKGWRVFFLGGRNGVAARAAAVLAERAPGLQVAGWYEGVSTPDGDAASVAAVRAAAPVHVLLVAYGAPAQEKWLARNLAASGAAVGIGVGGVFDYLSGEVQRAPALIRRLELEWLYRLLRQPSRWRRQLALPRFALRVLMSFLAGRPAVREAPVRRPATSQKH